MKTVLIAYTTNAGSTAEIAAAIGEELSRSGLPVEIQPLAAVKELSRYGGLIIGGPMLMGWHPEIVKFLKTNQETLKNKPVAYFLTALSLTRSSEKQFEGCVVYQDPALAKAPRDPQHLSFKENYATVAGYLKPAFTQAPAVKPLSAGFFAGKLDYNRLNLFQKLFVRLIIGAQPGDFRNWDAVRAWTAGLRPAFQTV